MPNELENAIKNAAMKVASYVENAATLTVETRYVEIGPGNTVSFDGAKPVARTTITLDGDCNAIIPMHQTQIGLETDGALFELHQRNVQMATEYRARMLSALWGALQANLK